MDDALLATSGETIKLWGASSYTFYLEIPFKNGNVKGLAWNQDGQCLASLGESSEEIFLSAICGKSEANIGVVRGIESPTCLSFACRSPHYLGVGSGSGKVTIWNVKSQAKKKVFTPTDQAITKIAFSHSDSHIAAATKKGTLYMLSIVNNVTSGPYKLFNNQVVSDVTYSRMKRSLLGCSSHSGSVALYDTHANKVVHSFSLHNSPVAGVCFSPVNELLMVSIGYDKKMICYNVQTKQPVMTHKSTAPLTSISFLGQGQLVALGTMTGQVLIHDMRAIQSPVTTIKAHGSAINNVLLQSCAKSKSVSSSKTGQANNTETALAPNNQRPSKSCSDQPTELSPDMNLIARTSPEPHDELSIFSPIRDTGLPPQAQVSQGISDYLTELKLGSSLEFPSHTSDPQQDNRAPLTQWIVDVNEDNLLSPVRETVLMKNDNGSPAYPVPGSTVEVTVPPTSHIMDKENLVPSAPQDQRNYSAMKQMDVDTINTKQREPFSTTSPFKDVNKSQGLIQVDGSGSKADIEKLEDCLTPESSKPLRPTAMHSATRTSVIGESNPTLPFNSNSLPELFSSTQHNLTSSTPSSTRISPPRKRQLVRAVQASDLLPDTPPLQIEAANAAAMDISPGTSAADSQPIPHLQMDLIRNCMLDVMEDFQMDFNKRLIHLQYVMTKMFIEQQEVMERLHGQYSLNEELIAEIERLRQQVAHLQAKY